MVGRYKEYPEYKNTDIKFLKNIPIHWVTSKVRYISSFGRGLSITKADLQDSGVPCVSYGEVHSMFGFEVDPKRHLLKCVNEEYLKTSSYALLSKGDFVFADTSEDIDGSGNFTQLISDERVFAGYHTVIVRPNLKNHYRFIAYLFDSAEFRTQIQDAVKGVKVFSITQAILKSADVWFPSYEEQQKIAIFLDHETAKIDTLIAKQEKLIELLKEKRQAVISHAVTKGLHSDSPMKDSGVEWLGEVPEHWAVIPNKRLFEITPKKSQIEQKKNELCSFIPMDKLKLDSLVLDEEREISSVFDGYTYFENEDILIAKVTPCFENKNMVVARNLKNGIGFGSSEIYVLRCNNKVNNDFMYYRLQEGGFMSIATAAMTGAGGLKRVPSDVISNFSIALPPLDEQINIVKALKDKLLSFDELSLKAISAIDLMKERKTALISAAVTGKIDVRDWGA
ncbi:restriction endonuclease subunit S [Providencia alcalifaciens]|uniref:restriction endonuclease subunit S n=1 Tax=Providencia alcalifaciens TaxID=126385 RepID=UPI000D91DFB0|nr:restriction endonuclease subunit S [Providencia alcalifaciens]MTC29238.1 restriction endonuclease subunit S [Providencia alcalifaciens]SPY73015.1 Type I restriction enzyme EcoKI specificity protein [Providencia alcalifaciens]